LSRSNKNYKEMVVMYANSWSRAPLAAAFACALVGCGQGNNATVQESSRLQPFEKGWSHNCTLRCTNVSVNQVETVERPGRSGFGTVCRQSRQACEEGRAAACADAVAAANNETLYDNCQLVGAAECVEGCTLQR
jgi:hypothetical protein